MIEQFKNYARVKLQRILIDPPAADTYDRGNCMRTYDKLSFYHFIKSLMAKSSLAISFLFTCLVSSFTFADYKGVIEKDFWGKLYPKGGKTFYCQTAFEKQSPILTVSHIYPTSLITKALDCRSERSCLRSNKEYDKILSDLHNMVPVNSFYHFKLKDSIFGNLDESNEANECGLKKRYHIIEPPDNIKGDVARIHFYMHKQYGLPLDSKFNFLKAWDKKDPADKEEIQKNNRIKEIQGNDNPYISNPNLADQLEF